MSFWGPFGGQAYAKAAMSFRGPKLMRKLLSILPSLTDLPTMLYTAIRSQAFSHLFAIVCLSLAVSLCYLLDPGGPWWTQSTCLRCPGAREKGNISVPTGVVCGLIALCFWILPAVPPSAIAVMATIKAVTVRVRRKLCHR